MALLIEYRRTLAGAILAGKVFLLFMACIETLTHKEGII